MRRSTPDHGWPFLQFSQQFRQHFLRIPPNRAPRLRPLRCRFTLLPRIVMPVQRPDVLFLLIGEGAEKARIKALAESRQLSNIRFLDQQPRERIPAFISASDACLVLLNKTDVFKTVIPTKMLAFMSCARPVIVGVEGQARQIVEEASAGIAIEPENAQALVQAITGLSDDQALRFELGQNGRRYITALLTGRNGRKIPRHSPRATGWWKLSISC
jgi:glycosyltransferase involved in cell wall biosynthesis